MSWSRYLNFELRKPELSGAAAAAASGYRSSPTQYRALKAHTWYGDHGNCFFHAWLDAWALTRFPPLHQDVTDVSELRKAVKQWICGNYNYLLNNGTIDVWLQEYPDNCQNFTPKICHARRMEKSFAMATHLQVSGHGARRHTWTITSRVLQWQTYDHSHSGGCFAPGQTIAADPPPYRARLHPATNEEIERHIETINLLLQEGKALQEDVKNFNILLDVYVCLPPRPNTLPERDIWDSLDPMTPLGIPVCKRFFGTDYAGYIVRYDHKN